jgi:hypothetical protein
MRLNLIISQSLSIYASQILIDPCLGALWSLHYQLCLKSRLLFNAPLYLLGLGPLLDPASMLLKCVLIYDIESELGLSVGTALLSEFLLKLSLALVFLLALQFLDVLFKAAEVDVLGTTFALSLDLLLVFSLDLLID